MNKSRLISVLGWEERFLLGLTRNIEQLSIQSVDLLIYEEYRSFTAKNLLEADMISIRSGKACTKHPIKYNDPVLTWKYLQSWVEQSITIGEIIWLDITTMPRETIWSLLFFLSQRSCEIHYVYWSPLQYDDKWLCKEPDKPRLLFKHSGVSEFGKDTALIILTGFDSERTGQLVLHYEPTLTVLGIQQGVQYQNTSRNSPQHHIDQCKGETTIKMFDFDAYEPEHGLLALKKAIVPLLADYNVVISSLGPKLSAISVYKLHSEFPSLALTYVPTKEYNLVYSHGIKSRITGTY